MRRAFLLAAAAIFVAHGSIAEAEAQAVRVGPGFVRAPYAAVDWLPNGAARVKAPFVNVYSPGFPFAPPFPVPPPFAWGPPPAWRYQVQQLPPVEDLGQMDWKSLERGVAEWTAQLDYDLGELKTGDLWKAHLKTAELAALVNKISNAPPSEEVRLQLQRILVIHLAAGETPEYRRITSMPSFQALGAVLGEYVTTPDERVRRQLYLAASELDRSLEQFKTGGTWQQYLEVAPGKTLSVEETEPAAPAPDAAELSQLLARFDSVEQNDDYRVIAAVPAFKATHDLLAAYLSQPRVPSREGIEELPAPRPAAAP